MVAERYSTDIQMKDKRMPILVVGSTKGGAGKSTLAANITVARANALGKDGLVLLVDGDEQRTATTFSDIRTEEMEKLVPEKRKPQFHANCLYGASIRSQVRALAPRYKEIIIDCGGRDTGSLRAALTVADTLLIPVQPRSVDIWALDAMVALVKEAREINEDLRAVVVLNAADPAGKDNDDALEYIRAIPELEVLPIIIGRRKAFANATANGMAVTEYQPKDPKAIEELSNLIQALRAPVKVKV